MSDASASPAQNPWRGLAIPDLVGRVVLVTGASSGIGRAVAQGFAAVGAIPIVHYHAGREAAEALVREIQSAGGSAAAVGFDAADDRALRDGISEALALHGRLDGLVNNAGTMLGRVPLETMDTEHFDRVFAVNVRSVFSATQAALPALKESRGFVINTTSIAGRNGGGIGAAVYGSAKAHVANMTRGMAKEFAPYGVRVNAVAPGVIATPFHDRYSTEAQLEAARASIPLGRLGAAEDCVGAYLFLASPLLSGYVTGQSIEVNGGQLMP